MMSNTIHSSAGISGKENSVQLYYRLITLWVICEALLGGIIHGLKLPVSGLIVGSSAVICISLIGYYNSSRGAIIKATVVVAIFKMMLSPQSPFAAYIAVFFQGITGEAIFRGKNNFRFRCFVFAIIALIESGIQRIIVMTVIGGKGIWIAINNFISGISGQEQVTNYSLYLCCGYLAMHIIAGIIAGNISSKIPSFAERHRTRNKLKLKVNIDESIPVPEITRRKKGTWMFVTWIVLLSIFIHAKLSPQHALIPENIVMHLLMRSAIIISTWVVIINPVLLFFLKKWLEKRKNDSPILITHVSNLLPEMRQLAKQSWKLSASENGYKRLTLFFRIVIINSLAGE
jgi:hypothetical protein